MTDLVEASRQGRTAQVSALLLNDPPSDLISAALEAALAAEQWGTAIFLEDFLEQTTQADPIPRERARAAAIERYGGGDIPGAIVRIGTDGERLPNGYSATPI